MLHPLLAAVLVTAPAPATEEPGVWRPVREDLVLTLDPDAGTFILEGTLEATLDGGPSATLTLGMNARRHLLEFEEVTADGAAVELNVQDAATGEALLARLAFAEPLPADSSVEVSFTCRVVAQGNQLAVRPGIALASWVEGWYPIVAPPPGSTFGDAVRVAGTLELHLPAGWRSVSNGELVDAEATDVSTVETWSTERALGRSFAAAPYRRLEARAGGRDVALYLLSAGLPDPAAHVTMLAAALAAMEERLGPYPFPSYAIAEVPMDAGAFGASSEQGFILVKPFFLAVPGGNLPLFAHEAAHGWWGNTVHSDGPGSLLCSESLAQYGAVIAAERVWGEAEATELLCHSRPGYVADQCARGYFGLWRNGADRPLATLQSGRGHDHTLADAKGHWVYHMLRRRVGDERFFATLRALIEEYAGRSLTLDALRARFQEAAPEAGLERFFAQWLDRAGAPVLAASWEEGADGVALTVRQLQEGEPYELFLDVALVPRDGPARREAVHLTQRETTVHLPVPTDVEQVRLDPERRLLLWQPEYGPAPVAGLEDLLPPPQTAAALAPCAGTYVVPDGPTVTITAENGYLMLTLGEERERLVHTGGPRYRSHDGFVVFRVAGERAEGLLFVRDAGGTRQAVRRD